MFTIYAFYLKNKNKTWFNLKEKKIKKKNQLNLPTNVDMSFSCEGFGLLLLILWISEKKTTTEKAFIKQFIYKPKTIINI